MIDFPFFSHQSVLIRLVNMSFQCHYTVVGCTLEILFTFSQDIKRALDSAHYLTQGSPGACRAWITCVMS